MISNCAVGDFDVVEITNELPLNRLGGVGSAVDGLMSGFRAEGLRVLWYLVDHHYRPAEVERILAETEHVAVGTLAELARVPARVAHVHTYHHESSLLQVLRGRRIVFTVHSLLRCEADSNGIVLDGAVRRQEETLAAASAVVLVSQAELQHYRRLGYLALNDKVHVIHNGLRRPAPLDRARPAARASVGFCGRLVPRKRPEYPQWLLREPGLEDCRTLVAGRGFSPYARALMEDGDLAERVRYLGWCGPGRLDAFYAAIDVLAIPSVYEPFGMVALEAIARRVPVVCPRIDGLEEILGEHAIYAESTAYADFVRAMRRWRAMPQPALEAMTAAAHARYESAFTDAATARAYRALFAA